MWEWMYEGFWDKLEHFCYKLCREESRAEDLTQEVFLKALQNRELLDSFNQRQCKAWLFATARNLYCDQLRRKMKEESLMREMLPEGDEEPPDETAEAALGTVDLETLLGESDVVSIHAPLNPATENLMTKEKFAMMKKNAILINVGRGPIVNEKDLAEALNAGVIAGAGLDVLSAEPMKADNPLLAVQDSRKLVITPHIAWASVEARQKLVDEVAENVRAWMNGTPRNLV